MGITLLLMLIPLMANWLNNEFHWKFGDFILMGAMIYGLGLISIILMNVVKNKISRWIITVRSFQIASAFTLKSISFCLISMEC